MLSYSPPNLSAIGSCGKPVVGFLQTWKQFESQFFFYLKFCTDGIKTLLKTASVLLSHYIWNPFTDAWRDKVLRFTVCFCSQSCLGNGTELWSLYLCQPLSWLVCHDWVLASEMWGQVIDVTSGPGNKTHCPPLQWSWLTTLFSSCLRVYKELAECRQPRPVGHSLGDFQGSMLCGLWCEQGISVSFASPKSGIYVLLWHCHPILGIII